MGKCLGPCTGKVTREEYDVLVKGVIDFLNGKTGPVIALAEKKMKEFAAAQHYEKAVVFRDVIRAIRATTAQQHVTAGGLDSEDHIGLDSVSEVSCVSVLRARSGKMVSGEYFFLEHWEEVEPPERIRAFLRDFYAHSTDIPGEVVVPCALEESEPLEQWLSETSGHTVKIHVPQRGRKVRTLELARQNAHFRALEKYMKTHGLHEQVDPAVFQLQEILGMPHPPMRIEGYDIANISGKDAVGSMVVFRNGQPAKGFYRRFKIRCKDEPDDYAMMREMLERRLGHTDKRFGELPDLFVIDGGKGHLNTALEVLGRMKVSAPVISIAKQEEDLYLPGQDYPLALGRDTAALQMVGRLRDEAHRFAQDYHHRLRKKKSQASALDEVPGVGPARKKALLRRFGSLKQLREASLEDIAAVSGIGKTLARIIKESLTSK